MWLFFYDCDFAVETSNNISNLIYFKRKSAICVITVCIVFFGRCNCHVLKNLEKFGSALNGVESTQKERISKTNKYNFTLLDKPFTYLIRLLIRKTVYVRTTLPYASIKPHTNIVLYKVVENHSAISTINSIIGP